MAEVHHFTYGWFNPVMAFCMAFLGSLLGLVCTARARGAGGLGRRVRWLVLSAISIGGAGVWLMHFMAILGFDVPGSQVRLDPLVTIGSLGIAIGTVGVGIFLVGLGRRRVYKVLLAGLITGLGIAGMHFTGLRGLRVNGVISYDPELLGAAVLIAVVAATVALWCTVAVRGWAAIFVASAVLAIAVVGVHYTGMAAVRVRLFETPNPVAGVNPFLLLVPITLLTAAALMATAFSALQAMTEEEFALPTSGAAPRQPATAPGATAPGATAPQPPGESMPAPVDSGIRIIPLQRNGFHRTSGYPGPSTGPSATLAKRSP